jgi:hypothetical protein
MATSYIRTDGFSPQIIEGPLSSHISTPVSSEVEQILSQSFYYLAKGRQSFVFQSECGKYVLKFFNQKYLKVPWYAFFIEKEVSKRERRRIFYEKSYELAYRELGDEIVYLHLGPRAPLPTVRLVDKASREHVLDLTTLPFVLQKAGRCFEKSLPKIFEKEGVEGLCREIDTFLSMISLRIEKNIADADSDVVHNWGHVEGRVFHLDPGRLLYEDLSDPARQKMEWRRATHQLAQWLKARCPEAADYLQNQVICYCKEDV